MAKFKPPKRLFKNPDAILPYESDRQRRVGFKHMTRDHADVLQNIEVALVTVAKENPGIDDRAVHEALQLSLRGSADDESTDPNVVDLCGMLDQMRAMREDVSDAVWAGGLRTVAESVRNHSGLAPGEKGYLAFVSHFVG